MATPSATAASCRAPRTHMLLVWPSTCSNPCASWLCSSKHASLSWKGQQGHQAASQVALVCKTHACIQPRSFPTLLRETIGSHPSQRARRARRRVSSTSACHHLRPAQQQQQLNSYRHQLLLCALGWRHLRPDHAPGHLRRCHAQQTCDRDRLLAVFHCYSSQRAHRQQCSLP
jgi:hypothetical protein